MASMHSSSSMAPLALLPLLLVAALIPSLAPAASHALDNGEERLMLGRFHGWMAAHGRSYATQEEKQRRFEIYRSNMDFIGAVNRDPRMSYRLGETPFTDLTHDEFMNMYSSKVELPEGEEVITTRAGAVHEGRVVHGGDDDLPLAVDEPPQRVNMAALPPSVDWRAEGVVTPVLFQGRCSSCWALVSAATIESAQAISTGGAPPLLSPQQLVDCDTYDLGCGGGWMDRAFKWVVKNGGITSAAAYPYTAKNGTCQAGKPAEVRLSGYKVLPRGDEAAIAEAVARQPVAVAFDANDLCFQHYFNGVYDGKCFTPGGVFTGGGACGTNLTHALALVGYGTQPDGTKYWIGKNTWSTIWGDNGYAYLLRDSTKLGLCGLAILPTYPIVKP